MMQNTSHAEPILPVLVWCSITPFLMQPILRMLHCTRWPSPRLRLMRTVTLGLFICTAFLQHSHQPFHSIYINVAFVQHLRSMLHSSQRAVRGVATPFCNGCYVVFTNARRSIEGRGHQAASTAAGRAQIRTWTPGPAFTSGLRSSETSGSMKSDRRM